jgi:hypothetical protein
MPTITAHFYVEPITVEFDNPPVQEKSPHCPDRFTWRDETFIISSVLEEWIDYSRRGRMARNMMPAHLASANRKGSWGVGRFYFRVNTTSGRIFEIYYDRAPGDIDGRKGHWFLLGERREIE